MCLSINQSPAYYCTVPRRPNHPLINDGLFDWLALTHSLLNQQHSFPLDFKCLLACKVCTYKFDFAHLRTDVSFCIKASHDGREQRSVFIQSKILMSIRLLQLILSINGEDYSSSSSSSSSFLYRTYSCSYRCHHTWLAAGIIPIIRSSKHGDTQR